MPLVGLVLRVGTISDFILPNLSSHVDSMHPEDVEDFSERFRESVREEEKVDVLNEEI